MTNYLRIQYLLFGPIGDNLPLNLLHALHQLQNDLQSGILRGRLFTSLRIWGSLSLLGSSTCSLLLGVFGLLASAMPGKNFLFFCVLHVR